MVAATPPAQSGAKSILVVDDDPMFARLVQDVLGPEGYQVTLATNGTAGLELLGGSVFDLILIDVRMPELDGPGFFRELQQRDPDLARRVMFMTGGAVGPETAELLFSLRVPCLRKPLSVDELRAAVERFFLVTRSFPGSRKLGNGN